MRTSSWRSTSWQTVSKGGVDVVSPSACHACEEGKRRKTTSSSGG
jgi:hypothetical protein